MLVSSAEQPAAIRALGKSSRRPEEFGADILFAVSNPDRLVGVQRKDIKDLIASVHDGRLEREVKQLTSGRLAVAVLAVEGKACWTTEGMLAERGWQWTRQQHRGLLWSIRSRGIWVEWTDHPDDTAAMARDLEKWLSKDRHHSLSRRPGPGATSVWGKANNHDWACHLLMGLEGVGPELAERIVQQFNGPPLTWTCTEEELMQIPGIGRKRAQQLLDALAYTVGVGAGA